MKTKLFAVLAALGLSLTVGLTALFAAQTISIKGSDTMVMLSHSWAEAYMKKNPHVQISVTGGGSGTGIASLLSGTCDIANASRAMKGKEIAQMKKQNKVPVATTVGMDGLSIAVNAKNPVKSLTLAQLKGIYTGKIRNWKDVGGHAGPIIMLSRENSSGTYVYFQEHVLQGERYAASALFMPSTKAIAQQLSSNKNAIGYGGVAYFGGQKNIKIVPVAAKAGATPVTPTDANVRSGKYPIARPLYVYTAGKPSGAAKGFIDFCLSPAGQKIVTAEGYVAVK